MEYARSRKGVKIQYISPEELEKKVQQVLDHKKYDLYREFCDYRGIEERKIQLLERMVRIKEEIKSHRIITEKLVHQVDKRFNQHTHQMDKRFEQVDKRFEQVDKRFEDVFHHMDKRFNLLT